MANIHVYQGAPTDGATDGTLVSEGTGLAAISVTLRADLNEESSAIKLAVRCESGFKTVENGGHHVVITPTGTTAAKWALAPDNAGSAGVFGAYGAALNIDSEVDATNTIFWAKAKATDDETPSNDTSVDLQVVALIGAV